MSNQAWDSLKNRPLVMHLAGLLPSVRQRGSHNSDKLQGSRNSDSFLARLLSFRQQKRTMIVIKEVTKPWRKYKTQKCFIFLTWNCLNFNIYFIKFFEILTFKGSKRPFSKKFNIYCAEMTSCNYYNLSFRAKKWNIEQNKPCSKTFIL